MSKGNVAKKYSILEDIPCWNGGIYTPKATRRTIMKLEHDSKVAGHFGRDSTME